MARSDLCRAKIVKVDRFRMKLRRLRLQCLIGASLMALALSTIALAPARAETTGKSGAFRIGILAEPGAGNTVPGLSQLTRAFSMALGQKVEFLVAPDYTALIEAQTVGRVDYAAYSAMAYAVVDEKCGCVEPLVAPTDADGAVGVRSVLVTRDDKLPSLAAMPSHRIAVAPRQNLAGWQLPRAELAGTPSAFAEGATFLERAETATEAEAMLADGRADAVFGWAPAGAASAETVSGGTVARLIEAGVPEAAIRVIWKSGLLRYGPHAVLKSIDPEAKRRLGVFLTNLKGQSPQIYDLLEPKHSGGFVAVGREDYAVARTILKAVSEAEPKADQGRDKVTP